MPAIYARARGLLRLRPVPQVSLLGRVGVIASPQVTATVGHANVDDGGAGLILQVRSHDGSVLARGDRVVLLDYLAERLAAVSRAEWQQRMEAGEVVGEDGQRRGMEVQFAETAAERLVLLVRQLLVAEEDHQVLHQCVMDLLEGLVAQRPGKVDAGNFRADAGRKLAHGDRLLAHLHFLSPFGRAYARKSL